MSTTRSVSRTAPATDPNRSAAALLLCAHGASGQSGIVAEHGAAIARQGLFDRVDCCALHGTPSLDAALSGLSARHTFLVPYLMAEGATFESLARRVARSDGARRVTLCRAVGSDPALATVIEETALGACRARGWQPAETALLLIAHGTRRHSRSGAAVRRQVAVLTELGRFAQVSCGFLSQDPSVDAALAATRPRSCVAVGFFADAGAHGATDVPDLLRPAGARVAYSGPIGANPQLRDIIVAQALRGVAQP